MTSILGRVVSALRSWLGLNDPAKNRLHADHGWLLPSPPLTPIVVPVTPNAGRVGAGRRN